MIANIEGYNYQYSITVLVGLFIDLTGITDSFDEQRKCYCCWESVKHHPLKKDKLLTSQYRFFFLGSTIHPRHICTEKGPSVTARRLFVFINFPMSLHTIQTNAIQIKFLVYLVNMGLVPNHNKYFLRNSTLHHFLLSPEVWNIHISINLTVTS